MIYVNGDGHAAASYLSTNYSWSSQDPNRKLLGQLPHIKNVEDSFTKKLSVALHQPYRLEAYEHSTLEEVIAQTKTAISLNPKYVIVIWPNFFQSSVEINGIEFSFDFSEIENYQVSEEVKKAMRAKMIARRLPIIIEDFQKEVGEISNQLEEKNIPYGFMLSKNVLPVSPYYGKWPMDPTKVNVYSWAQSNNFLNHYGYLNPNGHTELSKILIKHLTSQL
jgi:hypothetical protein